jgi:hypothetical protein
MFAFFEKYASLIKIAGAIALVVFAGWLGHHIGVNDTKLTQTTGELGAITDEYKNYQALVKERDDLKAKYTVAQSSLDAKILQEQTDVKNHTEQLLATMRDPLTPSVYAPSDCGEASSYPTVFGTSFGTNSTSTPAGLSGQNATVPQK